LNKKSLFAYSASKAIVQGDGAVEYGARTAKYINAAAISSNISGDRGVGDGKLA
jgi:hypothetical protein